MNKQFLILLSACFASLALEGCNYSMSKGAVVSGASLGLGSNSATEQKAVSILSTNCASCHGSSSGSGGVSNITDVQSLLNTGLVIPGNPAGSQLYAAVQSGRMPPGGPLPASQVTALRDWISGTTTSVPGTAGTSGPSPTPTPTSSAATVSPTYSSLQANIFGPRCVACHSGNSPSAGIGLDTYSKVLMNVVKNNANNSKVYTATASGSMPQSPFAKLNSAELQALASWINLGAANN
jgi:mono/diheme cytochrome c family protein